MSQLRGGYSWGFVMFPVDTGKRLSRVGRERMQQPQARVREWWLRRYHFCFGVYSCWHGDAARGGGGLAFPLVGGWGVGLRHLGQTQLKDLGRGLLGDLVLLLLLIGHPSWIDKSLQEQEMSTVS